MGRGGRTEEDVVLEDRLKEGVVLEEGSVAVEAGESLRIGLLRTVYELSGAQVNREEAPNGRTNPVDQPDALEEIYRPSSLARSSACGETAYREWQRGASSPRRAPPCRARERDLE